jgi:hypothetical protein
MSVDRAKAEEAFRSRQGSFCEGLRMPAHDGGAAHTVAGVRKPPREETAGGGRGWRGVDYGDLNAAGEVCDWS